MWSTTVACRCWWLGSQWREVRGAVFPRAQVHQHSPTVQPLAFQRTTRYGNRRHCHQEKGHQSPVPAFLVSLSWSSPPSFFFCHSFYLSQPPLSKRTWSILQNKQWPISTVAKAEKVLKLCRGKTKIILQGASNDTLVVTELWIWLSFLATKAKKDM